MSTKAALILLGVILLIMAVSALSGCEHTVYADRPVEVMLPTTVPCLAISDVPAPLIYPADQLSKQDTDGEIVGALLADRDQRAATEKILRNIIEACVAPEVHL